LLVGVVDAPVTNNCHRTHAAEDCPVSKSVELASVMKDPSLNYGCGTGMPFVLWGTGARDESMPGYLMESAFFAWIYHIEVTVCEMV